MKENKRRLIYTVSSIMLVILVLGFTGVLNITSFKASYLDSLVSSYKIIGNEPVRKIEYAVKYGKPLTNFYGMKELLAEAQKDAPSVSNLLILSTDGKILYDLKGNYKNKEISSSIKEKIVFGKREASSLGNICLLDEEIYNNVIPIYDRENNWIGSLDMLFSKADVDLKSNEYVYKLIRDSILLGVVASLLLILFFMKAPLFTAEGSLNRKRVLIILISTLTAIQIIFAIVNFVLFRDVYITVAREYTAKTGTIIQKDLNYVVGKGVLYEELPEVEKWMGKFCDSAPQIERISIIDNKNTMYTTKGKSTNVNETIDSEYLYKIPLNADDSGKTVNVEIELSREYIKNKTTNILLDMGTVMVTSFFFLVEISIFFLVVLGKDSTKELEGPETMDVKIIRPLCFIFYFGAFMSLSFIPILMGLLYKPIWGIPKGVFLGIPISVELIFAAGGTLLAGFAIGAKGWKPIFTFGLIFFCLGAVASALAMNAITFIAARGLFGFGYGFCIIAIQGFVNSFLSTESKNEGISAMNSGGFAGVNCGCAIGAMLAERIGYSSVFFITLFMAILAGLFAIFFMKNVKLSKTIKTEESQKTSIKASQFIFNKNVLCFFLFIVIPVAICNMFLEYFIPVYSMQNGVSSGDVGRIFMLNGFAIVYLGPVISKFVTKQLSLRKTLMLEIALIATSFFLFAFVNSLIAVASTAFLLGIVTSFGDGTRNSYFLEMEETDHFGKGKALGIFNVATKIGQTSGPMVFGAVMSIGAAAGVGAIGVAVLISLFAFLIFAKSSAVKSISNVS